MRQNVAFGKMELERYEMAEIYTDLLHVGATSTVLI